MLEDNNQQFRAVKPGAPKRGASLLAGLLRCRRCGRKLLARHTGRLGNVVRYVCRRGVLDNAEAKCIAFGGLGVDQAVSCELIRVLQPAALKETILAATQTAGRRDEATVALERDLQAARYEADRARRQFDAADPENRLVTAELERRWESAMARCAEVERRLDQERSLSSQSPPPTMEELRHLAGDFDKVWNDPATDVRLKKRLVRTLVHEVIVDIDDAAAETVIVIHWQGSIHTELRVPRRRHGRTGLSTPLETVEAVRILNRVCTDSVVAGYLNRAGLRTGRGNRWTVQRVIKLRNHHGIPAHSAERQELERWLTLADAAKKLGVSPMTLRVAIERKLIAGEHPLPDGPWVIHRDQLETTQAREVLAKAQHRRGEAAKGSGSDGNTLFSNISPEEAL